MTKRWLVTMSAIALATIAAAPPPAKSEARAAVQATLDRSASGWNDGDLDRFMAAYEPSPRTIYISGETETRGFADIRALYAKRFDRASPGAQGRLSVRFLDFELIDPTHAFAVGRFTLRRTGARDAEGLTSLLFHRTAGGWHIIADHS